MTLRLLIPLLFGILVNSAASAQSEFLPEQPGLVVTLVPVEAHQDKGTYVQAQLILSMRLRGKHPYEALSVTLPEIADAEIITIQRPRTRYLVSYIGAGHVYEASYAIIPQRSGMLVIPPVRAVGRVTKDSGDDLNFDLANDGFQVQVDPAVEGFSGGKWFAANEVEISETWSQDPDEIRFGDVLRREIHVKAVGTTGDRIPALAIPRAAGATIVDAGRTVETEITVNGTVGHLRQSWNVRMDRDDFAEIAPVRMVYWNALRHAEEVAWLPVQRIEPLPADASAIAARIMENVQEEHALQRLLWIEFLALLAAPFVIVALMYLYAVLPTARDLRLRMRVGRANSPRDALEAVRDWTGGKLDTSPNDPELLNEFKALNAATFSDRREAFHFPALTRRCLGHARRKRITRVTQRLGSVADAVLGRPVELGSRRFGKL